MEKMVNGGKLPMREWRYICDECARKHGARRIEGHCATLHFGYCDRCETEQALAHVADYDWPGVKLEQWNDLNQWD